MAQRLGGEFAAATPGAVPTATFYPEPGVEGYLGRALEAGARVVKLHVQVGGFDPRDDVLDPAWGLLAEAGVPVVVHCGDGPVAGTWTGLDVFEQVLRRHSRLVAVLAHAGMPDYAGAVALAERYPRVHLDTTMVARRSARRSRRCPRTGRPYWRGCPTGWCSLDFPNIPYPYAEQLAAIDAWAADPRLGEPFRRAVLRETPLRLLDG